MHSTNFYFKLSTMLVMVAFSTSLAAKLPDVPRIPIDTQMQESDQPPTATQEPPPASEILEHFDEQQGKGHGVTIPEPPSTTPIASEQRREREEPLRVDHQEFDSATALTVRPGQNNIVPIASHPHLNRIVTPFAYPVVHTGNQTATMEQEGRVIYIAAPRNETVTLFITDGEREESDAISLTLAAGPIPPQEVRLELQGQQHTVGPAGHRAAAYENSYPHYDLIRNVLRAAAKGNVPNGYNLRRSNDADPLVLCEGVATRPAQVLEGRSLFVLISEARNTSSRAIEVKEQECYQQGVLAISLWPSPRIQPGQSAELFAVFARESLEVNERQRPSLLNGGL